MIELIQNTSETPLAIPNSLPDVKEYITNTLIKPLICYKSQATKKEICFLPTLGPFYLNTYMLLFYYSVSSSPNPLIGYIQLGTTDFPYGFYDVTMYDNNISGNLDPANAIKPVWYGLLNLIPESTNPAVEYTDYNTNDSDTESVYITF